MPRSPKDDMGRVAVIGDEGGHRRVHHIIGRARDAARLPEVIVRIDPADDHLDLDALRGWLWDDEALDEASTSIGTIRSAQTSNRTVLEVTLHDYRCLPVRGASVAAWMRANKVLLTATLTRDDATTSVECATPEAVDELIRTLETAE